MKIVTFDWWNPETRSVGATVDRISVDVSEIRQRILTKNGAKGVLAAWLTIADRPAEKAATVGAAAPLRWMVGGVWPLLVPSC